MADTIIRLKVESTEYENRLKRAVQGMQQLEKHVREMGASFEVEEKANLEFVRALGDMETQTQSVKGQMREFTEAILALKQQYDRLTDEEKFGEWGQAMMGSIDKLKVRASNLKDEMGDLDAEIKHLASDSSTFDSLAGGVNLMVSAFQVGQGIIQMFGVENENAVNAIAKLQGAMAVTNGLVQLQNALQKESAVMLGVTTLQRKAAAAAAAIEAAAVGKGTVALKAATAAQKALNLAAKANPYVLLATAVVAVGAALWKMSKNSDEAKKAEEARAKAAEEAKKKHDEFVGGYGKGAADMIVPYRKLQEEWSRLRTDMEKNTWISNNKTAFDQLGLSVSTIADAERVLVQNTTQVVKAFKLRAEAAAYSSLANDTYVEFIKKSEELRSRAVQTGDFVQGPVSYNANEGLYDYDRSTGKYRYTQKGVTKKNKEIATDLGLYDLQKQFNKYIDKQVNLEQQASSLLGTMARPTVAPTTPSSDATDTEKVKTAADMWQELSDKIAEAERLLGEFQAMAANTELSEEQRNWAADMVKKYKEEIKKLKNTKEDIPIQFSDKGINELKNKIKEALSGEIFGSDGYALQATKIVDITTLENLLNTALTNGLNVDMTYLSGLFESIKLDADIDDSTWDALVAEINTQLEALDLPKIKLDVTTGNISNVTQDAKKSTDAWQQAANAVNNLGGALNNLEDPSAKVAGIIMQAVANIALGFAQAAASPATGAAGVFGWIAAATAGLATMTATIASVKSVTSGSYADGGIIPGNNYSGDMLTANVNAGELILNRAQQASIASQLASSNPMGGMQLEALVSGESLRLVLANNASRRGGNRGQYAITKFGQTWQKQ